MCEAFWGNFFTPKRRPGREEVTTDYLDKCESPTRIIEPWPSPWSVLAQIAGDPLVLTLIASIPVAGFHTYPPPTLR